MDVQLQGPNTKVYTVGASANTIGEYHLTNWLEHSFPIPVDFPTGEYTVAVRIRDENGILQPLGFTDERKLDKGFYLLTSVTVTSPQ